MMKTFFNLRPSGKYRVEKDGDEYRLFVELRESAVGGEVMDLEVPGGDELCRTIEATPTPAVHYRDYLTELWRVYDTLEKAERAGEGGVPCP